MKNGSAWIKKDAEKEEKKVLTQKKKDLRAEIKELEAKRAELDKEIEVYLKELGLVE